MNRCRLQFVLLTLFVAWTLGCRTDSSDLGHPSEHDDAAAASSSAPAAAVDTQGHHEPSDTTLASREGDAPWVVIPSQVAKAGDPAREGWTTEAFSVQAMSQLNRLGQRLEQRQLPSTSELDSPFAANARVAALRPDEIPTVYEDDTVRVQRQQNVATQSPQPADLESAFAQLVAPFHGLDERHLKFKLFRVTPDRDRIVTRQFFHFSAHSATIAREHNATWDITWAQPDANSPPKIEAISVLEIEEVTARRDGAPWLADSSLEMLYPLSIYAEALQKGIPDWRSNLEQYLGVYNFGHHGLAIGDVNGDLLDDVYVCQMGGLPNHLLIQEADGRVREAAAEYGVDFLDSSRSALCVDLDNDGDQDLVLALATGLVFMENQDGRRFVMRARINQVTQGFSLAAADYDADGRLDLYVCVYYGSGDGISELPLPVPYFDATNGGANFLIRNLGNWQFEDVTEAVGLSADNRRFSFAAAWDDFDLDDDPDLFVVNDYGPNHLYRNDGGHFINIANDNGLLDGAFGMSATLADYDHDGRQDLYVSNMFSAAGNRVTFQPRFKPEQTERTIGQFQRLARGNSLFRNRGDGNYDDVSEAMRVTMGRWSWGSLFADLNNDRWEDLLVTNGFITGSQTDDL